MLDDRRMDEKRKRYAGASLASLLDHWLEIMAVVLTALYLALIFVLRSDEAWCLLRSGKLNVLGDFLAGALTPLALLWLVVGYFLQRKEFGLQRQELEETRKTLSKQVGVLQEQAKAETLRMMPNLSLREGVEVSNIPKLRNFGGPARDTRVCVERAETGNGTRRWIMQPPSQFDTNQSYEFHIPEAAIPPPDIPFPDRQPMYVTVSFVSERHDRFFQRWEIIWGKASSSITEITAGPTPVGGEDPPPIPRLATE